MVSGFRPRAVEWIGSSLKDIRALPVDVRREFGQALFEAELGGKHPAAKPLKGDAFKGAGELEIVSNVDGDTFRAAYTIRFAEVVYVLHVFQKKATRGRQTAKADIDLIKGRLALAKAHHEANYVTRDTG
jgi:phage-related protein